MISGTPAANSVDLIRSIIEPEAEQNEICVRAGGDEFYLIGIGSYDENAGQRKIERFTGILAEKTTKTEKPFPITASIGCALHKIGSLTNIDDVLLEADEAMYKYKILRKKHRQ